MTRQFLLFRLAGPMAAWGDVTVGERRSIWGEPSKSGVLGFVAAALGLPREDTPAHQRLHEALGYAVRIDQLGGPLRDYHTAQAPKARSKLSWRTRRDELSDRQNLSTVLSERQYRVEAQATVAFWQKSEGVFLDTLQTALGRPRFAPYLGRRGCPLSEPVWARILTAEGLMTAFDAYDVQRQDAEAAADTGLRATKIQPGVPVWFELDAGLDSEEQNLLLSRQRRDGLRDRALRIFADRREGRLTWRPSAPVDPLEGILA
jgi:CRISPR system Cascade subunit CasD